jgi:hypothetical protein
LLVCGDAGSELSTSLELSALSRFLAVMLPTLRRFVLELSSDLIDESPEGELSDKELSALLETSEFAEGNGSGIEAVGLLYTSSGDGLLGSLLASGVLVGGVPGACNFYLAVLVRGLVTV